MRVIPEEEVVRGGGGAYGDTKKGIIKYGTKFLPT
jgi:hypothetical protein